MESKDIINNKIQEWLLTNDRVLVNTVYSLANPKDKFENKEKIKQRLNETKYSNLSNEELFAYYDKNVFNKLNSEKLEQLLQELHNRTCDEMNLERNHICKLQYYPSLSTLGYVSSEENTVCVNKTFIDVSKFIGTNVSNKNNVGMFTYETILHETRHIYQFENAIKFLLDDKNQSDYDKFLGACLFMDMSLQFLQNEDVDFLMDDSYQYLFYEQDSEHYALTNLLENYKKSGAKNPEQLKSIKKMCSYAVNIKENEYLTNSYKGYEADRIDDMDLTLRRFLNVFEENFEDCEIKEKVVNKIKEYLKFENNTSKFIEIIKSQFKDFAEIINFCNEELNIDLVTSHKI